MLHLLGLNPTIKSYKLCYMLRITQSKTKWPHNRKVQGLQHSQETGIPKSKTLAWIKLLFLFDMHNFLVLATSKFAMVYYI